MFVVSSCFIFFSPALRENEDCGCFGSTGVQRWRALNNTGTVSLNLWLPFVLISNRLDLINVVFLLLSVLAGGGGRLFLHCGIRRGEDNDKKQSKDSVYNIITESILIASFLCLVMCDVNVLNGSFVSATDEGRPAG